MVLQGKLYLIQEGSMLLYVKISQTTRFHARLYAILFDEAFQIRLSLVQYGDKLISINKNNRNLNSETLMATRHGWILIGILKGWIFIHFCCYKLTIAWLIISLQQIQLVNVNVKHDRVQYDY